MKEMLPNKCPMARVHDNSDDDIEKYFAKEASSVLQDLGAQLLTLASHPNLKKIVDTAPNGL